LTRASSPRSVLLGALVRAADGWRFVARELTIADGKLVANTVALGAAPVAAAVADAVAGVAPAAPASDAIVARATPSPPRRRWWPWAVAGGGVVVVATTIALAVVFGAPSSSQVSGPLSLPR